MQSIFRLPWCADQLAPRMSEKLDNYPSTMDFSGLPQLKRKRSSDSLALSAKKQRPEVPSSLPRLQTRLPAKQQAAPYATPLPTPHETVQHEDSASAFNLTCSPPSQTDAAPKMDVQMVDAPQTAVDTSDLTHLQQVIDNEFNMQILMKHNELRLIEQELAKCQIALEQLRRCEARPYPGFDGPSAAVSAGTGPAVAPAPGYTRPSHAAPYGVVDGPYTRHYRNWLVQDPQFDSMSLAAAQRLESNARSTRNSGVNRRPLGKSLPSSRYGSDMLPSLPNYPAPAPKDKSAPLVLRRSTDNQLVKLICNNCLRGNFSSIQGFLNHCRIAHKVDYKSHDAAAIDCGRLLDEQETANLPPETASAPAPKPSAASRTASAAPTPFKNLVHPMNVVGVVDAPRESAGRPTKAAIPARAVTSKLAESPLKPSSQAPRLSAHFAKHKLGGDLEQAIAAAKQSIDFGVEEVSSPDSQYPDSPSVPLMGGRTVAGAANAGSLVPPHSDARPISRKGHRGPRPSPLAPSLEMEMEQHSPLVSPHTADSNPGLVSDHEDDDQGSQSEDEAPALQMAHSLGVRRDCTDNMEIDVAVHDDIDENGVVIRRNSMDATAVKAQANRN